MSSDSPLFQILRDTRTGRQSHRVSNSPDQRITFAEYMDLALYHPQHGYYASGTVEIGKSGDFFTSPSLGADFGELLAQQFQEIWEILGKPIPFTLVEMGAGEGLLAVDILKELEQYRDLFQALEYIIVEQAPQLISRQQDILKQWLDQDVNIAWKSLEAIPDSSINGCCFSNELVDAFPVHQVVQQQETLKEVYLTVADNQISEIIAEPSTPKLAEYFNLVNIPFPSSRFPEGYRTEVNLSALDWLATLAQKLNRGYVITIDYGYTAERYYNPQRSQGTLQCYYQHRRHNNPYELIGQQDITSHVDFTALEKQGEKCGLDNISLTQQGLFLMSLGLGDRLADLSSSKYNLQQILTRRSALHQLIDPAGLGGFRVLVQGKGLGGNLPLLKGLTIPPMGIFLEEPPSKVRKTALTQNSERQAL